MSEEKKNPLRRFLGKVRQQQGQYGAFLKLFIDNPTPTKLDKSTNTQVPDQYNKGVLLWLDNETGKKYLVKQLSVRGVSNDAAQKGFTNSVSIDLDNEYEVQELG
jgi:hypothetical protein